ncbi:Swr1 protein [Candida orthopsilosis Co 90-125]|uniref:Helicase SWR1 n=1 Tax=Candida orthopsilosis (strain 90-125) TaxID=1136231 RepID=H8X380_CANO9|nr:Swr1 protein [Candida orthopsilosis Co 90-125]CCG25940.1 Swr1 protein [Candida orthopsilosis Co 90-125]
MTAEVGRRRASARLNSGSASAPIYNEKSRASQSKRSNQTANQNNDTPLNGNKRRKVNEKSKEDKLASILLDFDLAINELYHLSEYKSIITWVPAEFSKIVNKSVPESFAKFCESGHYNLKWDKDVENDEELKALPFRFQKKKLSEREALLNNKFPFREQTIEKYQRMEKEVFSKLDQESSISHSNKSKIRPSNKSKESIKKDVQKARPQVKISKQTKDRNSHEDKIEESNKITNEVDIGDDELDEQLDVVPHSFNKRIKQVSRSLPKLLITHPSHVPGWVPQTENDLSMNKIKEESEILEFEPESIKVEQTRDEEIVAPNLTTRLQNFLENYCKTPIIDESNAPDFKFTKEEFESINSQQIEMFKTIWHKINIDNTLEFNANKIERRKVIIPPVSNVKLNDPFRNTSSVVPKMQGSNNDLTYQDHLLTQGMAFSRIHHQMRRQHLNRARKVASIVDQHFKKKKGEKERLLKEREQNLKKMSRVAMQAVKKRWNDAFKVYSIIQTAKEEELKKVKGREHLSQMLQHSTQLLEAQLTSSKEATAECESIIGEDDDMEMNDSGDSDNFTSSSDDNDDNDDGNDDETESKEGSNGSTVQVDPDSNLSVEELRRKYANIESSVEPTSEANSSVPDKDEGVSESGEESEEESFDETGGLMSLYGEGEVKPLKNGIHNDLQASDDYLKIISESDLDKNQLLDSDESSPISGSSSDSESSAESVVENGGISHSESEPELPNGTPLANLYASKTSEAEDSDDGDVRSFSEESDDELSQSEDETQLAETSQGVGHVDRVSKDDGDEGTEIVNGSRVRDVEVPSLLRGTLRPYQKQGLNWLASLYNNNTNGILADEMGLGKTIQTISLLSYLACEHHVWGPHLIIVPTSVMLNWDMEFKKFAPGFKVLTYYGSPQQRAQKRKGWNKPDAFHVCITSYQLVVQDQQAFKRRRWRYMILDEAHNIKNFRSTRWKALLNFNTENRLLLTGTPLQNNLIELWSLLYFLMPSSKANLSMPDGFSNLEDFQQWFGKPVDKILEQTTLGNNSDLIDENEKTTSKMDEETKNTVSRLHQVLRPYILRRLKKDVEKQMPGKYEHIVYCRLSKRQRYLYDDFMSRAKTKETLASGNFLSIINCLMQLRKVCNHPDLFEVRPIVTSFSMPRSVSSSFQYLNGLIKGMTDDSKDMVDFNVLNLNVTSNNHLNHFVSESTSRLQSSAQLQGQIAQLDKMISGVENTFTDFVSCFQDLKSQEQIELRDKLSHILYLNTLRCEKRSIYSDSLLRFLTIKGNDNKEPPFDKFCLSVTDRANALSEEIEKYSIVTPAAVALDMKDQLIPKSIQYKVKPEVMDGKITNPFHQSQVKLSIAFPDKTLLQFDCGKLQKLAQLLRTLTAEGHRALIFTQMTKVLDILEQFLNIHGYRYMRLDGATKIEDRQLLTEKFNRDPKIPVFILSTRSGGLGINLTGADTVIFYDSDWNPAMDKQCQDRCHRIGQVRDVHIYRFVSESTIESNIIKKANQKRQLDNVVIQEGEFTTDYLGQFSVRDLVNDPNISETTKEIADRTIDFSGDTKMSNAFAQAEDEEDRVAAGAALKEVAVDDEDFTDENKTQSNGSAGPTSIIKGLDADDDIPDDIDYEEGVGHIDEYMLRFISDGYY